MTAEGSTSELTREEKLKELQQLRLFALRIGTLIATTTIALVVACVAQEYLPIRAAGVAMGVLGTFATFNRFRWAAFVGRRLRQVQNEHQSEKGTGRGNEGA